MTALIYAGLALLAVCVLYTLYGLLTATNRFHWKFGLIATAFVGGLLAMIPPEQKLQLGIDLSGGTILVYQVKEDSKLDSQTMDELVTALVRRVNASGLRDIPIRRVGNNRVEIILAKASAEEVEQLKKKMSDVGSLEFRILANRKHDSTAIERALAAGGLTKPPSGYRWARLGDVIDRKVADSPKATAPRLEDATHLVDPVQKWAPDRYAGLKVELRGKDAAGKETSRRVEIKANSTTTLFLAERAGVGTLTGYRIDYNPSEIAPSDDAIIRDEPRPGGLTERFILYKVDRYNVTGEYLSRAYPTQDERVQPAVGFAFNPQGARKFGSLTREFSPEEGDAFKYRLAVILDNWIRSAPSINQEIRDSGIIEGVQPKEVPYLVEILQAGRLPATVDPVPLLEERVGPTLGRDTIQKGLRAIVISMLVVPVFMIIYYRFAGLVAVACLVLNMVLLVASMALTGSSFTLPGLAGLALTIGMAVDANVLIFERMREEKERGASMAQQVRNGFARAWSTILDSNVTTILSGLVLWAVGTPEVKGFATTLIIGLIWNLFTAVWVSRVIFDFCLARGWMKKLTMMKILDRTSIDFVGPRRLFMLASAVVIALGLTLFFAKGQRMYNIDFTGGTLVTIRLNERSPAISGLDEAGRSAYVREQASRVLPDVSIERLNVGEEGRGIRFNVRTTAPDVREVQTKILDAFKDSLARLTATRDDGTPIPSAPESGGDGDASEGVSPATRFAGGTRFSLSFSRPVDAPSIRQTLDGVLEKLEVSNPDTRFEVDAPAAGVDASTLTVRTDLEPEVARRALDDLAASLRDDPALMFDRLENFGGAVAGETRNLAITAIIGSWLIIVAYLWFRFKSFSYGLAAVIALVHDVLIALGAVALMNYKIDLPMIAAFLTLIGFSVNDTIVIFDRIREIRGKTPNLTPEIVNAAVNQTLSRTILTSLTAWLVVAILYLFGGEGLQGFSFCLVIGFLSGTYSTIYIAAPILIEWGKRDRNRPTADRSLVASR